VSDSVPILLYGTTVRSPELRHEVPLTIVDPFLFVEADGRRVAVIGELEIHRVERLDGIEVLSTESLGLRELRAELPQPAASFEVVRRACRELGVSSVVVPTDFPLGLARFLEEAGIELDPRDDVFTERRRRKSAAELEGILAAQRAADAAMGRVRELLAAADPSGPVVMLEGEALSSERLRDAILEVVRAHDTELDELMVSHGAQTAIGHEVGHGNVLPGEPLIVDIWPRDRATGCHTDMTRTFVCGEPPEELVRMHALCLQAMDVALELIEPGAPTFAAYAAVCELFELHGHWTPLARDIERPDALSGFPYALGHGVGLELHEQPGLTRGYEATFVEGEVIAVEPALYRGGFGGCRLEDIVLVTEGGCRPLTQVPYDLAFS
jgi:Xaa-Pro aminopeptidase